MRGSLVFLSLTWHHPLGGRLDYGWRGRASPSPTLWFQQPSRVRRQQVMTPLRHCSVALSAALDAWAPTACALRLPPALPRRSEAVVT